MAKRQTDAERQRYVLYFRGHRPPDVHPRCWVPIYWDPALAHGVVQKFLGDTAFSLDGNTFTLPDGIFSVTCEQLDAILDTEPAAVPDELTRTILRFKLGSWEEDHSKPEVKTVDEDGEVKIVKVKAPKPERPKKAAKPDNFVTISEWSAKWGITPMEARTMLRASDLEKPPYGWAFDPKDEKKIKKICGVK